MYQGFRGHFRRKDFFQSEEEIARENLIFKAFLTIGCDRKENNDEPGAHKCFYRVINIRPQEGDFRRTIARIWLATKAKKVAYAGVKDSCHLEQEEEPFPSFASYLKQPS
ncbi:MAG: hypothetical protein IPN70_04640 [Candidatus Moraniibacteriota bacterium]|nr:MAG: hypothetical protein IPN70_04640 [Candidatus Moranbacteria bacterium]